MAKVLISIVYYGETDSIKDAVDSIERGTSVSRQILLVHNGGDRKAIEDIVSEYGDVRIVDMPKNVGFGAGHNASFKDSGEGSDYFFIVNPDVVLKTDAVDKLVEYMEANPDVGAAVPRLTDNEGNLLSVYRRDPTVTDMFLRRFIPFGFKKRYAYHTMQDEDYETEHEVPFPQGSFLCVRSSVFKNVGGFDERFFLYMEDADLCRKIRRDHKCMYYPKASVVHFWNKGSHRSLKLFMIHMSSMIKYFNKWGWKLS